MDDKKPSYFGDFGLDGVVMVCIISGVIGGITAIHFVSAFCVGSLP